jgi:hypothetical protein
VAGAGNGNSPGIGAKECSPRRKPWVGRVTRIAPDSGRKNECAHLSPRFRGSPSMTSATQSSRSGLHSYALRAPNYALLAPNYNFRAHVNLARVSHNRKVFPVC